MIRYEVWGRAKALWGMGAYVVIPDLFRDRLFIAKMKVFNHVMFTWRIC